MGRVESGRLLGEPQREQTLLPIGERRPLANNSCSGVELPFLIVGHGAFRAVTIIVIVDGLDRPRAWRSFVQQRHVDRRHRLNLTMGRNVRNGWKADISGNTA